MLKAIIFDMDGVLVNSEPLHYEVDRLLLEEMGYTLDYEYYKQFIGSTNTKLWTDIKAHFSLPQSVDTLKDMADAKKRELVDRDGFPPICGVYDMLKRLHDAGYKLAVASSSPQAYIEEVTAYFHIKDYFQVLVSADAIGKPKPAPDIYLKAARQLGVAPADCMALEDSANGIGAAKAAGMTCIGFYNPDSGDQDQSKADYIITDYSCMNASFVEMVYGHATGQP
jgi:HAD superfamily hydrolase (TIGR01509 family)